MNAGENRFVGDSYAKGQAGNGEPHGSANAATRVDMLSMRVSHIQSKHHTDENRKRDDIQVRCAVAF
ncbi:hypothetical protein ACLOJK_005716 [Asimina triloba]